jgi:hypothetical protein
MVNKEDTHGIGMALTMVGGAILYLRTGTSFFHYDTLIYLMIFIGMIFINKAFNDAKRGKQE